MSFGREISTRRRACGLSPQEFADASFIEVEQLRRIELGAVIPEATQDALREVLDACEGVCIP